MAANEVQSAGVAIRVDRGGHYHVTVWHVLGGGGRMQTDEYDDLAWAEVLDVVVEGLQDNRPGWALGRGWQQPALPFW